MSSRKESACPKPPPGWHRIIPCIDNWMWELERGGITCIVAVDEKPRRQHHRYYFIILWQEECGKWGDLNLQHYVDYRHRYKSPLQAMKDAERYARTQISCITEIVRDAWGVGDKK